MSQNYFQKFDLEKDLSYQQASSTAVERNRKKEYNQYAIIMPSLYYACEISSNANH